MLYYQKTKIDPEKAFQSLRSKLKFLFLEMTDKMDELREEAQESLLMQKYLNFDE